jgi:hypothetical protein
LDDSGYAALVEMADDREGRLAGALERQFAALRQDVDRQFGAFRQDVDQTLIALESRINLRFAKMDERMAVFDQKLETNAERNERRILEQCGLLREAIGGLRTEMVQQRADLLKWAMLFWISQAAAIAGIVGVMR